MIIYWAWPKDGAGHATRAAAICRWLHNDVMVIRGTDRSEFNRPLDHFQIPYVVIPEMKEAVKWAVGQAAGPANRLVVDHNAGTGLDRHASVYVWRFGRSERTGVPTIRTEGPGSLWPILLWEEDEILSREEAREDLGVSQTEHLTIAVPSIARPGLVETYPHDLLLDPDHHWPAVKWLRAADHIVGTIGANLYAEVGWLGIPVTWIKIPNVPDQSVRIVKARGSETIRPDGAKTAARIIDDLAGCGGGSR